MRRARGRCSPSPPRRWPRDDDFLQGLLGLPFYAEGRPEQRRLILETFERRLEPQERVDLSCLTVEHVMPQKLSEGWRAALGEGADEGHESTVHRLGNLTLTGHNAELSNAPFAVKREKLAESNVRMNREIAEEGAWGFEQIEARGRRLAGLALAIWPGPVTGIGADGATGLARGPAPEELAWREPRRARKTQ